MKIDAKGGRAFGNVEVQAAHVPEVQRVGHASDNGDGDEEPAVNEEAHTRVANGERVEEEWVHEQPRRTHHQQKHPVPFFHPFPSRRWHHPTPPTLPPPPPPGGTTAGNNRLCCFSF